MKLTIFNGSPRGSKGNTKMLVDWFKEPLESNGVTDLKIFYLKDQKKHSQMAKEFINSEYILFAFPLYTDAMPGIVKLFIDSLEPYQGKLNSLKIMFMVHSGFPEPVQSRTVEKYLQVLTGKLDAVYLGTIIKGGSEGLKIMPPMMVKKTKKILQGLGEEFLKTKKLNAELIKKLATPEKMSPFGIFMFKLFSKTGLTNFYWNGMLKKNKVFDRRFDAPYN
ncbi:MAG: NAD(P)H-dependent oxidoreductase [Acidobacteriota bacterium]